MKRIVVAKEPPWNESIRQVAAVLGANGVVVLPTETVYGIVTLWGNAAGRARIFEMKGRPRNKPLQMLAPDLDTALAAGLRPDPLLDRIAKTFWPGPLTVVAPAQDGSTIGVRIPAHPFVLGVLREISQPLAATSANRSGERPAVTAEEAVEGLCSPPDLVVDGGVIEDGGDASTVVRLRPPDAIELLREGPVSLEQIRRVVRRKE